LTAKGATLDCFLMRKICSLSAAAFASGQTQVAHPPPPPGPLPAKARWLCEAGSAFTSHHISNSQPGRLEPFLSCRKQTTATFSNSQLLGTFVVVPGGVIFREPSASPLDKIRTILRRVGPSTHR